MITILFIGSLLIVLIRNEELLFSRATAAETGHAEFRNANMAFCIRATGQSIRRARTAAMLLQYHALEGFRNPR
jgi:hypothetical protein